MGLVILTFDIEDFINPVSAKALEKILILLKRYSLRAIFFVTGYLTEKLQSLPSLVERLEEHEIGYHSSSHSVRPTIPEYTDTNSYYTAVKTSLDRETSYINPLTGEIEGSGGIYAVREMFSNKEVTAFRSPGFCWTPPHIEALKELGIKYDFSSGIYGIRASTDEVYEFKGLKFFPYPIHITGQIILSLDRCSYYLTKLLLKTMKRKITCLYGHEWELVLKKPWDSIYKLSNPRKLYRTDMLEASKTIKNLFYFEIVLRSIKRLVDLNLIDITTELEKIDFKKINSKNIDVLKTYSKAMEWRINTLNYKPKNLSKHFYKYLKLENKNI
ncbi:polysaccharide deacetylase family protein [Candidatus Bathyarchaeota archaeon]|nr:polysaccharide deacetylase family protein [Candidatus Bathyarchaeota archaeon]